VCVNKLSDTPGAKAFILNIKATEANESTLAGTLDVDSIQMSTVTKRSRILIFEDSFMGQIALENIFYEELKLKESVSFYNSGKAMATALESLFEEAGENQVALIIMDYKMPGLSGTELIKQV
jgi:hypothetical protein